MRRILIVAYVLLLGAASVHLYRQPIYSMDSIQYMGNALLMEDTDPVRIHEKVYAELNRTVPQPALDHLLGKDSALPPDQDSYKVRAADPYRYVEFLPLFAIRPLYNQTLWLVSKTGLGLMRSAVLISVGSYFLLGILLFLWVSEYTRPAIAALSSLLIMLSPPLTDLGRDTTSDALATLVAFLSLYLIFEKRRLALGLIALLASIFFRTDFVVLAGPVILACWLEKRLTLWQAGALSVLAVASVIGINHFGGDYGIKMLYYRNFVGAPTAPAEMVVHFSVSAYLAAFRHGITLVLDSFFLPFLLLGALSIDEKRPRTLFAITAAYVLLHFVILPNWQERWVGIFYLSVLVCAAMRLSQSKRRGENTVPQAFPVPTRRSLSRVGTR